MRKLRIVSILCLGICIAMLAVPRYRARAEAAWQILFNGKVSKVKMLETDSGTVIPIYFEVPAEGETATYGVRLENDPRNKQIKVTKVKKKGPLTERGDCPKCEGSEDCQDCYPAGSGEGTSGGECYSCNATGDCPYCEGSGDCYTCGGGGFPNGCNTCGDVSN